VLEIPAARQREKERQRERERENKIEKTGLSLSEKAKASSEKSVSSFSDGARRDKTNVQDLDSGRSMTHKPAESRTDG